MIEHILSSLSDPYFIIALVIGITVHEFSHAWAATMLGDPTPKLQGRLSLNPLNHMDPLGTFMLLLAGFGWGKPVQFSLHHLRNPRVDAALIAFSGPFSNLLVALAFALPFRYAVISLEMSASTTPVLQMMSAVIQINIILMVFNMLPIPPLDGSKVASLFLPGDFIARYHSLRNYGTAFLLLLVVGPSIFGFSILGPYILAPALKFFWSIILFGA